MRWFWGFIGAIAGIAMVVLIHGIVYTLTGGTS